MFILGSMFLGADGSYAPTPTGVEDINYFSLGVGEYEGICASTDLSLEETYAVKESWDMNTIFAGSYDENIHLSNVDFTLSTVSQLAVKKREKNTFPWTTIFVQDIHKTEDFTIAGIDIFNAGNTAYQYALIPMLNGNEGNYHITEAVSDFDGLFLLEKDKMYGTILDITCDTARNHHGIRQESLYSRYPKAIYNSCANYETGTVQGYFCKYDVNKGTFYPEDSVRYRKEFVDFLTNGNPKILKLSDGRIWLVNIDENTISDTEDGHLLHRKTSFGFFESGDYRNEQDLYEANLIDVAAKYWSYI